MQKSSEIKLSNKVIIIKYNLGSLLKLERTLGHSINAMFAMPLAEYMDRLNIDFAAAAIVCGAPSDLRLKTEDALNIIQQFCDEGGNLDEIYNTIVKAILATGLFTKGVAVEAPASPESNK